MEEYLRRQTRDIDQASHPEHDWRTTMKFRTGCREILVDERLEIKAAEGWLHRFILFRVIVHYTTMVRS